MSNAHERYVIGTLSWSPDATGNISDAINCNADATMSAGDYFTGYAMTDKTSGEVKVFINLV